MEDAATDPSVGVVVLRGAGDRAFTVGGDATEVPEGGGYPTAMAHWVARVHALIRDMPQPVIAAVNGYAIGGGHVLQTVCDLAIAAENARFGQVGPRVGSFDGGFGAAWLTRLVGERKAREMWFICKQYSAQEALEMGLVNKVVPLDKLDDEVESWCNEMLKMSPTAIKMLKYCFNTQSSHIAGLEQLAFGALYLYYGGEEATEGRKAYLERRPPNFSRFRG